MTDRPIDATDLFARCENRGISLEWLAAMTGVSWATVYAYKVGRRRVQGPWLERAELVVATRDSMSTLPVKV